MAIHILNERGKTDMARKALYQVQQWEMALARVTQVNLCPTRAQVKMSVTRKNRPETAEKPAGLTHAARGHVHGRP